MTTRSHPFASFMAKPIGRGIRILAGLALIGLGSTMQDQTTSMVLMLVGLVPLFAGVLNVCLIAPIIGAPFSGRAALPGKPDQDGRI